MKRTFTQSELIALLELNPESAAVFFNESGDSLPIIDKYIFFDAVGDVAIKSDNSARYASNVQFQIYAKDIDALNAILKFLQQNFIMQVTRGKKSDNGYNVATCETQLFVNWGI